MLSYSENNRGQENIDTKRPGDGSVPPAKRLFRDVAVRGERGE